LLSDMASMVSGYVLLHLNLIDKAHPSAGQRLNNIAFPQPSTVVYKECLTLQGGRTRRLNKMLKVGACRERPLNADEIQRHHP
jgi:hypothetical protein